MKHLIKDDLTNLMKHLIKDDLQGKKFGSTLYKNIAYNLSHCSLKRGLSIDPFINKSTPLFSQKLIVNGTTLVIEIKDGFRA
jgi:hypothetical protein